MKFMAIVTVAVGTLFAGPALADDGSPKELLKVVRGGLIQETCGDYFAVTTYGNVKPDAKRYIIYRSAGETRNDAVAFDNIATPIVDEKNAARTAETSSDGKILFRMNEAAYKEAASCLPPKSPAPPPELPKK